MSGSSKPKLDSWVVIVVIVVIAAAAYGGVSVYRSRSGDTAAAPPREADAAQQLRITLDPNQFVGDVKKAYQIAEHDPALLAQLHCYCGCDRTDGHKNLLDC